MKTTTLTHKTCKYCQWELSIDNFYTPSSDCKNCTKELRRIHHLYNKDKLNARSNAYYQKNKEQLLEKSKNYYIENKEKVKAYRKVYSKKNSTKIAKDYKEYRKKNHKKLIKNHTAYVKKRKESCPKFALVRRLQRSLNKNLQFRNIKKSKRTLEAVGCTAEFLIKHIESQFVEGMTWDNRKDWQIDHIIPMASAKTEEDVYRLSHYTNLRPLWTTDNHKKTSKIIMYRKGEAYEV